MTLEEFACILDDISAALQRIIEQLDSLIGREIEKSKP